MQMGWFLELEPEAQRCAFKNLSRFSGKIHTSPPGTESYIQGILPSVPCTNPKYLLPNSAAVANIFYHLPLLGNTNHLGLLYYAKSPESHKTEHTHTLTSPCRQQQHTHGWEGQSFSQKRLETLQTQTCSSSVPAWAPGPPARRAAPPAGSWPGTAWPSARSNYLHGLVLWRWISETPPRSPGWKHHKIQNDRCWLQTVGITLFLWEKCAPHHWKNGNNTGWVFHIRYSNSFFH